jgi:RNA polymerase sigma-70 factor (ECF subfamily)
MIRKLTALTVRTPPTTKDEPRPASDATTVPVGAVDTVGTVELLARVRGGDSHAVETIVERSLPPLRRWARGRLPQWARSLADTQDLVQDAVVKALPSLKTFDARHPGALQSYLRVAVQNRIYDEIRRVGTRPAGDAVSDQHPDSGPSPLQQAMGREAFERYETALATLKPAERDAIVARMELQHSYEEVAVALGKPNANAARMAVTRAVARLVEAMEHRGQASR